MVSVVTFAFDSAGAASASYTPPADGTLLAVICTSSTGGLSWNPSRVTTDWTAPTANEVRHDDIICQVTPQAKFELNIPVTAGKPLYVVNKAATDATFCLYFDYPSLA